MATMTGSEKQVAWAEKVRDEWVAWQSGVLARSEKDLARETARAKPDPEDLAYYRENVENDRAALDAARQQTSAAFWLDSRGMGNPTVRAALLGQRTIRNLNGVVIAPVFAA